MRTPQILDYVVVYAVLRSLISVGGGVCSLEDALFKMEYELALNWLVFVRR